jgi:cell division septation protein DedD
MSTKDFREIQVSSSLLVVIFLCVLALGVFIFLLGVSVGKKQVRLGAESTAAAQVVKELPEAPSAENAPGPGAGAPPQTQAEKTTPPAPVEKIQEPSQKAAPDTAAGMTRTPSAKKTTPSGAAPGDHGSGLYYVQVAAFREKVAAVAEGEKFRRQGYTVFVTEPRATDTTPWYRVRLGGFPTRAEARSLLDKLNDAAQKKTDFQVIRD